MKSDHKRKHAAVIGLGVGQKHLEAFLKFDEIEKVHICDFNEEKLQNIIQTNNQKIQISNINEMIRNTNIEIVSIATYDHAHAEHVLAFIKAGKNIFVEKPLCTTFEDLRKIQNAYEHSHDVCLMSNLVLRAAPLYMWLKEAISLGEFGEIYSFEGDYLYGRLHKILDGWRKESPNYSVMLGGGIHLVDLLLYLTNQKPDAVYSKGTKVVTKNTDYLYDDHVVSLFEFASGMIGKISANFSCVHPHHHHLRIYGSKATFIYDDQGPRVFWKRGDQEKPEFLKFDPLPASKGALIPKFIESIDSAEKKKITNKEFDLISVILAANKSLETEKNETITYV